MMDESTELVNPFLHMIVSVLKFSQKRKICQPRFTLSIEGLYQIYQAGSVCNQATKGINPDFALEAILMSAPPISIFLMVLLFIPFINFWYEIALYFISCFLKAYKQSILDCI